MVLIGALHGILLFPGDIVGAYGLLLVLFGGLLVRGRTVTLAVVACVGVLLTAAVGTTAGTYTGVAWPSMASSDLGRVLLLHAGEWAAGTIGNALSTVGMLALGALAARRRVLDDPAEHRALLRRTAALGLLVAVPTGVPLALDAIGVWQPGSLAMAAGLLHQIGGLAGGLGFGAVFGLLALRPAPRALIATGQRSLSNYLVQSVVFCALLPAWTLGLGAVLTVWQASLLGLATWLLGIAISAWSARAGRRGPAETVLRRLTYGSRTR
jgi:uncharacterized protein